MRKPPRQQKSRSKNVQFVGGPKQIAGWSCSGEDERPIKNLNGKSSKKIREGSRQAYFQDSMKYWRRIDTNLDVELDETCVEIHARIRRSVLSETELRIFGAELPEWVFMAGIEPESKVSKKELERLMNGSGAHPILFKCVYLADVQSLVTNIQRTSAQISQVIGEFFGLLNDCKPYEYSANEKVGVRFSVSSETALLHAHLETIFVRMRSLLDYSVKLAMEAERNELDFSKVVKLCGASSQYSDRKNLQMNETEGTVFAKDELIWMISSIRDRIVHDGHLDASARIYEKFQRKRLVERFVLLPDMVDGRFEAYKNRKNFYGVDRKINLELPDIYDDFFTRLIVTLKLIGSKFSEKSIN